jgi:phospholipid/cholesterol/gamma-HCH transport system ATP-binding protein
MAVSSIETRPKGSLRLAETLLRALDGDPTAHEHLLDAGCAVQFRVLGSEETAILDLTGPQVQVTDHGIEPDVMFELSPVQAGRFVVGQMPLGASVLDGHVAARGPVRDYLTVDPILQRLLRDQSPDNALPGSALPTDASSAGAPQDECDDALAIETRDLHKQFGAQRVLGGVNLRVPEGAISVVLGPSGTGKSVLIKHIIGVLKPDRGEILVRGRTLHHLSDHELEDVRRDVGVMYQDGALFSSMTVYDNVAFPLRQHTNMREREIRELVLENLRTVGLEGARARYPSELSGGMRKRAGLARAVVLEPRILLCDEPDSGLDPVRTSLIGQLLLQRHARLGGTIMVVTHNIMLARAIADHVSLLWQGEILVSGSAAAVFASEEPLVKQFLAGDAAGPLGMD